MMEACKNFKSTSYLVCKRLQWKELVCMSRGLTEDSFEVFGDALSSTEKCQTFASVKFHGTIYTQVTLNSFCLRRYG